MRGLRIEGLAAGRGGRRAKFQDVRDFHEDVIEFSLVPCEKCEVHEFIPCPQSSVACVQSLEERVNECCFGDPVAPPGLVYMSQTGVSGPPPSTACEVRPCSKHPKTARIGRGRACRCWFHRFQGGEGRGQSLEPRPQNDTYEGTLGPSRKRDLKPRSMLRMTPFDNGTVIPPAFPTEVVSPDRGGVCKSVRMRIMPTVDHLPLQIPANLRGLTKPVINVRTLFGNAEPRLRRSVPNDRDAIAHHACPESTAVCAPMFPS